MDQLPLPLDNGPPVLSGFRVTGEFRGKPIYDGECTYLAGRTVSRPPLVPLTKERYLRLVMLGVRADSARHAGDAGTNDRTPNDAYAAWMRDKSKREADMRKSYDEIKKVSPQAAEQMLQAFKQQEKAVASDGGRMRGGSASIRELENEAAHAAGARIQQLQAQIAALSTSERQESVAVMQHGAHWDFRSDELAAVSDADATPLVQIDPAFYDKSLAADVPQIIWVCIPGLQGSGDAASRSSTGDEQDTARAARRRHDALLIRDHLDWAALQALVTR